MKPINGKALYSPKGAAQEYGRVGCNFYTGCPHGCTYCYLKRGITGKALGGTEVQLKKCFKDEKDAMDIFKREVNNNLEACRQHGIFFSFTTDPLIKETRKLTFQAMASAISFGVPVYVLTKDASFIDSEVGLWWLDLLLAEPTLVHFGFTLTGRDDMEPNASSNEERINAMRILHHAGFPTWASIEPVIDWASTQRIVVASIPYCDHYKIGLRSGVKKDYYKPEEVAQGIGFICEILRKNGRTVYLKESVRKVLRDCIPSGGIVPKHEHWTELRNTGEMVITPEQQEKLRDILAQLP